MSQITDSQLHPLVTQDRERIDLLYGGSESEVLNESIQLSRDLLAEGLKPDETMLYINTLVSTKVFASCARRACRNTNDERFKHITVLNDGLTKKLEFLTKLITEKQVRYVILNGFEFATFTSRHRIQIFCWLKSLRDACGASVIVFTQSGPRSYGTLGQMRFVSETCEEVGAYKREKEEALEAEKIAAEQAAKAAEAARPKSELEIFEAKIKKNPDGTPMYYADRTKLQWLREKEEAAKQAAIEAETRESETLKNKELEVENVAR
jgi:hypothetical protein